MAENRRDILSSMDSFIEKIQQLKGLMVGVTISALILAPLAIGISAYLITHPKFLHLIEIETDFALMLLILLIVVLVTSGVWLVTGIRQFRSLNTWDKRYRSYVKKREKLDESIASKYHLDE